MPTSGQRKWYPRKPPTLQIKILNTIATNGPLSKNMAKKITGSHYPDVSDAIDKLVRSGLICIADVRLNDHDKLTLTQEMDVVNAEIDKNIDYVPPCDPMCKSGPPIS